MLDEVYIPRSMQMKVANYWQLKQAYAEHANVGFNSVSTAAVHSSTVPAVQ